MKRMFYPPCYCCNYLQCYWKIFHHVHLWEVHRCTLALSIKCVSLSNNSARILDSIVNSNGKGLPIKNITEKKKTYKS